jgi:hypothetical protein
MNARKLLTLPYRAYRTPLATLDAGLGRRLPKDSPPMLILERILGSYDQFAGRLLNDDAVTRRGTERLERTGKLADAALLERRAAERRTTAERIGEAGADEAADKADQAAGRLAAGLDAAAETEGRRKQEAAKRARTTAAQRKQAADAKATQRRRSVQERVEQTESAADKRAKAAQNTAKAKLNEVADERAAASGKRSDAEQLDSLVETKRDARTDG